MTTFRYLIAGSIKEKYPNYRRFAVPSLVPSTEPLNTVDPSGENDKELLAKYE